LEDRSTYGSNVEGRGCSGTQVGEAEGRLRVVDVEADTCNKTKRGRQVALEGRRGAAAALNQYTANFHRQGAQGVDVVGPLDPEHVAQLRQLAFNAAHYT
jgi:hypothetical protein